MLSWYKHNKDDEKIIEVPEIDVILCEAYWDLSDNFYDYIEK